MSPKTAFQEPLSFQRSQMVETLLVSSKLRGETGCLHITVTVHPQELCRGSEFVSMIPVPCLSELPYTSHSDTKLMTRTGVMKDIHTLFNSSNQFPLSFFFNAISFQNKTHIRTQINDLCKSLAIKVFMSYGTKH